MRTSWAFAPLVSSFFAATWALPRNAAAAVDSALIGTWQLQWPGAPIFWALREDGVYRLYGLGANPGQHGMVEATGGRFSMKSAFWADQGTYQLSDADTWVITGVLGPGTWKRVWAPGAPGGTMTSTAGTCGLVTPQEVALVLREPVDGGPDRRDPNGCAFQSSLSDFHSIRLISYPSRRQAWELDRRNPSPRMIAVPGVGEDAYAEINAGGDLVLNVLKGSTELRITLTMKPGATAEDLPLLGALAHAADGRLSGFFQ
jgi:hypothetical protein